MAKKPTSISLSSASERKIKANVTIDCSGDPAGRFVASNEKFSGRVDEKDPTSDVTGPQIWRNKVYYCKSPNTKARLGASVKYFLNLTDEELMKYIEDYDIDQLYTLIKRAESKQQKVEGESALAYARLVKAAKESIKEYEKTVTKGKHKGIYIEPKMKTVKSGVKKAVTFSSGMEDINL